MVQDIWSSNLMNKTCNWIQLHAMLITTYYSILTPTPMVENGSAIISIKLVLKKQPCSTNSMIGPPSLYWCVQYQQKPDTSKRSVHYTDIRTSLHHHDNILLSYLEKWEILKVQEGNRKFSWFSFKSDSTNPIFMSQIPQK